MYGIFYQSLCSLPAVAPYWYPSPLVWVSGLWSLVLGVSGLGCLVSLVVLRFVWVYDSPLAHPVLGLCFWCLSRVPGLLGPSLLVPLLARRKRAAARLSPTRSPVGASKNGDRWGGLQRSGSVAVVVRQGLRLSRGRVVRRVVVAGGCDPLMHALAGDAYRRGDSRYRLPSRVGRPR